MHFIKKKPALRNVISYNPKKSVVKYQVSVRVVIDNGQNLKSLGKIILWVW